MADLKISALTASTTPLAGTEVLPIVQSSTTKQVSVANLTAGRAVSALSYSTSAGYTFRAADNTNYELLRYVGGSNNPGIFVKVDETTNTANLWLSGSVTTAQVLGIGAAGVTDVLKIGSADVTVNTGNFVIGTSGKGIDFAATSGTGTSELLADYEEGTFTPTVAGVTLTLAAGRYTKIGRTVFVEVFCRFPATVDTTTTQIANLPFTPVTSGNTYLGNVGVQSSLATHARNVVFATGIQPQTSANASFTNANFSSADVYIAGTYTA